RIVLEQVKVCRNFAWLDSRDIQALLTERRLQIDGTAESPFNIENVRCVLDYERRPKNVVFRERVVRRGNLSLYCYRATAIFDQCLECNVVQPANQISLPVPQDLFSIPKRDLRRSLLFAVNGYVERKY